MRTIVALGLALATPTLAYAQETPGKTPPAAPTTPGSSAPVLTPAELVSAGVRELVAIQEADGAWPYEGVYRVDGQIPVGYRIGGTSLVVGALQHAAPAGDEKVRAAMSKGVDFVLANLDHPLMAPSTVDAYDVRVWGHACALELFARLRAAPKFALTAEQAAKVEAWIPKLVSTLVTEELRTGGWNYASRRQPASFVTAFVAQSLLWAKGGGAEVPTPVLARARRVLEKQRPESGAFAYAGGADPEEAMHAACARAAECESTLRLLGGGSVEAVQAALDAFHAGWEHLAVRRKKTGTHVPPYSIAPYYFYFGHRYAAQAIQLLPEASRAAERAKLLEVILRTRDEDGTWNDRVFPRTRNYGTTMVILALLGDASPLPPACPLVERKPEPKPDEEKSE